MSKKIALVSGSTRGIGFAIVQELAMNGFRVYVNGRGTEAVERAVEFIRRHDGDAQPLVADLTDPSQITAAIAKISGSEGPIDHVVANIGSGRSPNSWNVELEEYRRIFELNYFSAVVLCTQAAHHMRNGCITLIGSIAGCESMGAPLAYTSAKAALLAFMKGFSDRVAEKGIRVNAVSPGNVYFEGGVWDNKLKENKTETMGYIDQKVPLRRFATAEEIAKAVHFLYSSEFITGHNLVVDGGQLRKFL